MKNIQILILFFCAFCTFSTTYSQLERYSPEVVLDYVNGHAKNGATDTYLTTIVTVNGSIPTPLTPINLNYSFEDGKNLSWLYLYYSPSQTQFYLYAVTRLNVFGNVTNTAFDVDPNLVELDFETASKKELSNTFLATSSIITRLQTNAVFNKFRTDYPDTAPNYVALLKLDDEAANDFPELNSTDPYWLVVYQNMNNLDASMTCFVNSETQDVLCVRFTDITNVEEQPTSNAKMVVAPNPVLGNTAAVQLPSLHPNGSLYLYNSIGEVVGNLSGYLRTSQLTIPISVSSLPSGMYYVRLQDGTTTFTTPLVIQ